jgi:hypothetical protein
MINLLDIQYKDYQMLEYVFAKMKNRPYLTRTKNLKKVRDKQIRRLKRNQEYPYSIPDVIKQMNIGESKSPISYFLSGADSYMA